MIFDDLQAMANLDQEGLLQQIISLPSQLEDAYQLGLSLPLPISQSIKAVIFCGMGGSATGGDLLSAFASPTCPVPMVVHRDYDLPAWAHGREVLVIACSHSGNTEEILSSFETAYHNGCLLLAVGTGGRLMTRALELKVPFWQYQHAGQARAAVGWSFGLMAAALTRLGLLSDIGTEISAAAGEMRQQIEHLLPGQPVAKNRAKRDAGQLMGRSVVIFGSDHLSPVARRWKDQINESAKTWAQAEALPEADHTMLVGTLHPENNLTHTITLFLEAPGCHPRNQARARLTRYALMQQGLGTDSFRARGANRLAQMWTCLHFGDFMAYYLAIAYGVNPSAVEIVREFKIALKEM